MKGDFVKKYWAFRKAGGAPGMKEFAQQERDKEKQTDPIDQIIQEATKQ